VNARRALPWVLLALGVVAFGLVARSGRRAGAPLDPRSTEPSGAKALTLLLREYGADVAIGDRLPPSDGTVVLLRDELGRVDTAALHRWVGAGGTLVVADPTSDFAPVPGRDDGSGLFGGGADDGTLRPSPCGLPELADLGALDVGSALGYRLRSGDQGCFPVRGGFFVVRRNEGAGHVVAIGGAGAFTNASLDGGDDAALAVRLMAPQDRPGAAVRFLLQSAAGSGRERLLDLVSRRVKDGFWQLLLAMACIALWRARRLGRPQLEPQPVEIPASELVVAVGNLLHQGRRREAAATMLRARLRRVFGDRLGMPADAPVEAMAAVASARAGLDPDAVRATLAPTVPTDDAELIELARSVESMRNEVARAR